MANDMNNVNIIGRLTRDPNFEYKASGFAILNFSLAVNRSRKTKEGTWEDEVSFFDCVLFGKQAENLKQYMTKGKQVAVEGYLKQDRWQAQDGSNRSRVTVGCNNVQLLGGRSGNDSGNGYQDGAAGYDNGNGYADDYGFNS